MSFEELPDELIVRIFHQLNPSSFINIASTCKRFNSICNGAKLIYSYEWASLRPLAFNFYLPDSSAYSPNLCQEHGSCAEQNWRYGTICELAKPEKFPPNNRNIEFESDKCYYHRLYCLLNSKYRTFSTIRLKDARLADRGCLKAFSDSLKLNELHVRPRIDALVELELYNCDITLDWLNSILNELINILYLTLDEIAFTDPTLLIEAKYLASKTLSRLRITGDRSCRMNDSIFMYFLENFPSHELDLTGTRVEFHKRIIQRFYTNASIDFFSILPSEYIFTFPMILQYLKKYRTICKRFIANETDIIISSLRTILQEDDLKHLRIVIENCPLLTQLDLARARGQVSSSDLSRVTF